MFKVTFTNGDVLRFDNLEQAEEEIKRVITNCDFEILVTEIVETKGGKVVKEYGCQWDVELVPFPGH